jgi:L-fucose mutarotase
MLKGISRLISPKLLKTLCEMGHGDEIVFGDANFPSETCGARCIRADGIGIPELLDAILPLYPLDTYVDAPVTLMKVAPGDEVTAPDIWEAYRALIASSAPGTNISFVERFAFYERAKKSYAVVATGEQALYANIILKKGVVTV